MDESGVCVESVHTLSRTRWAALSWYVETRWLFVLFSADKEAAYLTRAGDPRR
ncbi:hypothetical protein ACFU3O_01685 [Streptomyces antibioticus]|uniref:hypothetical protein n=1 Tax=Streptomyces antibioticus TaxID=1890 RepID=UPI0033BC8C10